MSATPVTIGLSAVAMAPRGGEAAVLTVRPEGHQFVHPGVGG